MSIIGGVLLAMAHFIDYSAGVDNDLGTSIVLIAHLLLVFAFIRIYEAHGFRNRWLRATGMILSLVGTIFVDAIVYVEAAIAAGVDGNPVFTSQHNALIHSVGPLLFVLCMILVGMSVTKSNVIP